MAFRELAAVSTYPLTDVAISGGGFAGLTLALALVRCLGVGFTVTVLDRAESTAGKADDDPRAVAISASSRRLLEALELWRELEAVAEPVRRIEITDSGLDAGLRPVLLAWDNDIAEGSGPSSAAHIVPLPALATALEAATRSEPAIQRIGSAQVTGLEPGPFDATIKLGDGSVLRTRLVVAADGQRSALREAAGIKSIGWPYSQIGIVTTVAHDRDHEGVAVQHFLPGGPFAILPLRGRRCCVTWTESEAEGRRIMALDDAGFLDELDLRFGGRLGTLRIAGGRRAWPLALHLARAYVATRLVLVGDAAHSVHPIAGQGMNLAFRDVAALTEVIADAARTGLDHGEATTLERYERWRRFDSSLAAAGFDALNRLFSREGRLLRSAREFGLQVIDRMPGLKRTLVGEAAGLSGELPKLLRGELA
jgi:2-octaprenyl-6-methoxyphenol hydroxylase